MEREELLLKLELIHTLEEQQEELSEQIETLQDSVKAEMSRRGVDKLVAGLYRASWTKDRTTRFDVTRFKSEHKNTYEEYLKPTLGTRFTVSTCRRKESELLEVKE